MNNNLKEKLAGIELLIFDVDGVLTDNSVLIGPEGLEMKKFNIADGLGIHLALKHGIRIAFISGRPSRATEIRARELGVADVIQKPANKLQSFRELAAKYGISDRHTAFAGNDLVDIEAMAASGVAFAVPDSPPAVLEIADYITRKKGGEGAAREIIDMVLEAKGIDEKKRLA